MLHCILMCHHAQVNFLGNHAVVSLCKPHKHETQLGIIREQGKALLTKGIREHGLLSLDGDGYKSHLVCTIVCV